MIDTPAIKQRAKLLRECLGYVLKVFGSNEWINAFEHAKARSIKIKFCTGIYHFTKKTLIGRLFIAAFGVYSALTCAPASRHHAKGLFLKFHPNEESAFLRLKEICEPEIELLPASLKTSSLQEILIQFSRLALLLPRLTFSLKKRGEIPFFVACQYCAMICSWACFVNSFKKIRPSLVATSTNSMPAAVCLPVVAKAFGVPTAFCAHGMFADLTNLITPLSDFIFVQNQISEEAIRKKRKDEYRIASWGWELPYSPMRIFNRQSNQPVIGIFPTTPAEIKGIKSVISAIRRSYPKAKIELRLHPLALLDRPDDEFRALDQNLTIDRKVELKDHFSRCDIAIVGNTSVMPQALRAGVPVVYDSKIDIADYDIYNFIKNKVVIERRHSFEDTLEALQYYQSAEWRERFKRYDPYYGVSANDQIEKNKALFFEWLKGFSNQN